MIHEQVSEVPTRDEDMTILRPLARQFPNLDLALSEIARLSAELALPKGTIHVISDVHGDNVKLRHVINNASGTLRPLVERHFSQRLSAQELQEFLTLIFYPRETLEQLEPRLQEPTTRMAFCQRVLQDLFDIVRILARRYTLEHATQLFPPEYRQLLWELLAEPSTERGPDYVRAIIDALVRHDRALYLIRLVVRVVRNLAVDELILAGDFWDRGQRGDLVMDYIVRQPVVTITWGNHDVAWLGACLGQDALIAHVLRISLRYRRLSQLEMRRTCAISAS